MEPSTLKRWFTWPIVVGVIILIGALYIGGAYNGLVTANEQVDTQWGQVESQYQRRMDLVPNLVNSVKGAMQQEETVFTAIADARTRYAGATTPDAKVAAAGEFESAFARLLVVMENYPELKSVDTVQGLMAELAGTENRIAVERMRYNEVVRDYNLRVKRFPGALVAGMFGFEPRALFEGAEGSETAPIVDF